MQRRSVDLPEPEGPMMTETSPGVTFLQVLDADEAHWLLSLFKILAAQVSTSTKKK